MTTTLFADAQASLTRDLHALTGRLAPAAKIACVHRILATVDTIVHDDETPPDTHLVNVALDAIENTLRTVPADVAAEIAKVRQALRPGN